LKGHYHACAGRVNTNARRIEGLGRIAERKTSQKRRPKFALLSRARPSHDRPRDPRGEETERDATRRQAAMTTNQRTPSAKREVGIS
jgi:hypothetical protein